MNALVSGCLVTGLALTASPALADTERPGRTSSPSAIQVQPGVSAKAKRKYFNLTKTGFPATTAWGSYYWSRYKGHRTRSLEVFIKDNKKGKSSCVNVLFAPNKAQAKRGMPNEDLVFWNPYGKGITSRSTVQSYRVGYMYMRECEGYNTKKGFKITSKGKWYRWAW